MTDITGGLDLLGDWLDAKGYTEEAGLCTRAMDEINRLRDKNIEYEQAMMALQLLQRAEADVKFRAENARLRAALKPFAGCDVWEGYKDEETFVWGLKIGDLRVARAVYLGESDG